MPATFSLLLCCPGQEVRKGKSIRRGGKGPEAERSLLMVGGRAGKAPTGDVCTKTSKAAPGQVHVASSMTRFKGLTSS